MSKIKLPSDFLENTQFLKTILEGNFALLHNDYRPLEEFNNVMLEFGRDVLRQYLFKKNNISKSHMEVEDEIKNFEQETYGTSQKPII